MHFREALLAGRWGTMLFALATVIAGAIAAVDGFLGHHLSVIDLCTLGAAGLIGVGLLLNALLDTNKRATNLEAHASELRSLTIKLEDSLRTVSAMNARLHESEARYKGLVDSQGDAIVRRAPDSSAARLQAQTAGIAYYGMLRPDGVIQDTDRAQIQRDIDQAAGAGAPVPGSAPVPAPAPV